MITLCWEVFMKTLLTVTFFSSDANYIVIAWLWPCDAVWCRRAWSLSGQVMTCRMFDAKTGPGPMSSWRQLDPKKQVSLILKLVYQVFIQYLRKKACKITDILSWPQCAKTRYHTIPFRFRKWYIEISVCRATSCVGASSRHFGENALCLF